MKAKWQVAVPQISEGTSSNAQKGDGTEAEVIMREGGCPKKPSSDSGVQWTEEIRSHEESMLLQRVSQGIRRGADMTERVFEVKRGAFEVYWTLCRPRVIFVHDLRKYTTR